jgi:hypothetical protein
MQTMSETSKQKQEKIKVAWGGDEILDATLKHYLWKKW